ncbi:2-C-methyl-D-erythritol 2,4-cyclodiphosphate synthase [Chlamydiales bacterium SCGC AB-751-O23]|jgi:2-C-methyl-D-erythritol 2,4-cyclodiphosphate synthase|nr:2-C-methyl-D-erythritol 2,4-cyclodiphosphate synthase [Chlamydiales bacterium SCGC AB-751-O23]
MKFKAGIGQDSHRFLPSDSSKPCIIGGVVFDNCPGFLANSDGDVVLHAICNAITSITHLKILGGLADELCEKGITDGRVYLEEALKSLGSHKVSHLAVTIEAKKPHFSSFILPMREKIAEIMSIDVSQVGITATSGEGLTQFACGEGVQCFVILTVYEE